MITVEVAWTPGPREVERRSLALAEGARVADALAACGLSAAAADCGIWGRRVPPTQLLRDGDRVEVYRPLVVDPKEARRRRQQGQRARKTKRPATAGR